GELEKRAIVHGVLLARQAIDAALDPPHTRVVRGGGEVHAAEALPQVGQVIHGRLRRAKRVAALVHPRVHRQPVQPPRARHELPHPDRFRATHRRVGEAALDQAEVEQVLREVFRPEPLTDHPLVAPQPGEPDLEPVARVYLEELEVLEHPPVGGEARDVDVEGGRGGGCRPDGRATFGSEQPHRLPLHILSLEGRSRSRVLLHAVGGGTRSVQAVQYLLICRGVARLPGGQRRQRIHPGRRCRRVADGGDQSRVPGATAPAGGTERRAQERDQRSPRDPAHRVAKKLPRMRFVAFRTASAAPRGASVSVRQAPTSREARVSCRTDSDTITTVASNARTAFTPSSSKPMRGWTTRSSARTVASAQHRSSPACEITPSDSPVNCRPSAHVSTTLARHRPFANLSNWKSWKRSRSPPAPPPPDSAAPGVVTCGPLLEAHFKLMTGSQLFGAVHHVHLEARPPLGVPLRRYHQDQSAVEL